MNSVLCRSLLCVFLSGYTGLVLAGSKEEAMVYQLATTNRMLQVKEVIVEMVKSSEQAGMLQLCDSVDLLRYYNYFISSLLKNKQTKEADIQLKRANLLAAHIERKSPNEPYLWAFRAFATGYSIRLSPLKAPVIGRNAWTYAKKALASNKQSPVGYIAMGNTYFYAPSILGGDKDEALKYYLKAIQLFEGNKQTVGNFEYLNTLRFAAEAYEAMGDKTVAMRYCEKALRINPRFHMALLVKKRITDDR